MISVAQNVYGITNSASNIPFLEELFSYANILSTIAIVLSVGQLLYDWHHRRKKIRIRILRYLKIKETHLFYLSFENMSTLPICISRIQLDINNLLYDCAAVPQFAHRHRLTSGKEVTFDEIDKTLPLPICLSELGGLYGYVVFDKCPQDLPTPPTQVTFRFCTNRGNPVVLSVQLDEIYNWEAIR